MCLECEYYGCEGCTSKGLGATNSSRLVWNGIKPLCMSRPFPLFSRNIPLQPVHEHYPIALSNSQFTFPPLFACYLCYERFRCISLYLIGYRSCVDDKLFPCFKVGTRVWFWTSSGDVIYGSVKGIHNLPDVRVLSPDVLRFKAFAYL